MGISSPWARARSGCAGNHDQQSISRSPAGPSTTPPTASTEKSATSGSRTAGSSSRRQIPRSGRLASSTPRGWSSCRAGLTCTATSSGPRSTTGRKLGPGAQSACPARPPHSADAQRHDGERSQHVRHRLQVCRDGIYDGIRRRHPATLRAACSPGVRRYPLHRQGILRPDGEQSLRDEVDPARGVREASGVRRAGCWARRKGMRPSSSIRAASRSGSSRQAGNVKDLDTPVDHFGVTPRQIIRSMAQAVDELRLPHPVHIHTNNLGLPGNWTTTLETMKLLEGHRGHLTHIQFHSYGGRRAGRGQLLLEGRSTGRVRECAPQSHRGCRPGRFRPRPRA